jgi:4-hydroxybenzoate polyprenyltransferase
VKAVRGLTRGKAALKRDLAGASDVDVSTLPYNADVLAYIDAWKSNGGSAILVTATDQHIADEIAAHLGVFDAVHGSDGTRNLKGENKAAFLTDTFGHAGFAYMGDTDADLPVWRASNLAVSVNAPQALREKADALGVPTEHLGQSKRDLRPYAKALRPHQWVKNILVFIPMLLAHNLDLLTVTKVLLGFCAFSVVASGVYVLNDLLDLAADRTHPRKSKRPFAAGTVPIEHGTLMAAGLLGLGTVLSLIVGPVFWLVLLLYFSATTGYSFYFKRRIIIDITVLSGLYTMRIIAGGVAAGVGLSVWLLAFSVYFFFALAAIKRQAELVDSASAGKLTPSGRGYTTDDLPIISQMSIASGYVSVLILALYMNSPTVTSLYANPPVLWGVCPVILFWISWISILTHRGQMHDDPIVFAIKDRISRICGLLVVGFAIGGSF